MCVQNVYMCVCDCIWRGNTGVCFVCVRVRLYRGLCVCGGYTLTVCAPARKFANCRSVGLCVTVGVNSICGCEV